MHVVQLLGDVEQRWVQRNALGHVSASAPADGHVRRAGQAVPEGHATVRCVRRGRRARRRGGRRPEGAPGRESPPKRPRRKARPGRRRLLARHGSRSIYFFLPRFNNPLSLSQRRS